MTNTEPEPVCKFEQGCHRVVPCDPGCAAPAAVSVPPPAPRADALTGAERQFLTFALDLAFDRMVSDDGFTDEDEAALAKLRRLADETQQPEPKRPPMDAWRLLGIDACPTPLTHNAGCGCPTDQTPAAPARPAEEAS